MEKISDGVFIIQSQSESGTNYLVNVESLTCTCPHFSRKLSRLPPVDPERLCKHLIETIVAIGIPDNLSKHREKIIKRFNEEIKKQKNKKVDLTKYFPKSEITTTALKNTGSNIYVTGRHSGGEISIRFPSDGNLMAHHNYIKERLVFISNKGEISGFYYRPETDYLLMPKEYKYLRESIKKWINVEYEKIFMKKIK